MPISLEVVPECESTNSLLRDRKPFPDGTALLALRQTGGHGRRGRTWWSTEGNLALSVALLENKNSQIALLTFRAGIALYDSVEALFPIGVELQLKWPNDLYLQKKKLAGMIAESRQQGDAVEVVLGVGVNLVAAPSEGISVAQVVEAPDPVAFAKSFLDRWELVASWTSEDVIRGWNRRAKLEDTWLEIEEIPGLWKPLGILPSGELEVVSEGGEGSGGGQRRVLASEEVKIRVLF